MTTEKYRAEWSDSGELNDIESKMFDNKGAAQSFARRKSGEPMKPGTSVYIVRLVDDVAVGHWFYYSGFTYGYEDQP